MTRFENNNPTDQGFEHWQKKQRRGRIFAGLLVITAGIIFMLHKMEYAIPDWFFTWPTLILGASLIALVKHGWNDWRWISLAVIGSLFLGGFIYPESKILEYKIPIALFIIGAILIFKPKNKKHMHARYHMKHSRHHGAMFKDKMSTTAEQSNEDYIFVNNIFAGSEKVIFSKDFKGGEIKNTFGGCEINLMQAEITGEDAVLILNQQFGGVKLIVPANWIVKSDINCVFAGIEDKRHVIDPAHQGNTKNLILRGSLFMSGLEIVSY